MNALFDLPLAAIDLAGREVAVAAIDCLELATVDGHDGLREQVELAAQRHEAAADVADTGTIVAPEVGNSLEVRCQAACQPHQLDIASGLTLQATARLD